MGIGEFLFSLGLSIVGNLSTDKLKDIIRTLSGKNELSETTLKKLFIKSFYKSLDLHDQYYDDYAKKIINKLRKTIKKDEFRLINIFSRQAEGLDKFLSLLRNKEFLNKLERDIINEYNLRGNNFPDLIPGILSECFSFYHLAFFNLMSEKEGLQIILKECFKINHVLEILKSINTQLISRNEFNDLKMMLYKHHFSSHPGQHKNLTNYDGFIKNKFRFIELRGFSPQISGKIIQMELVDVFVPLEIEADNQPWRVDGKYDRVKELPKDDGNSKAKIENIIQTLFSHQIVILGDPGSGKSTLLKYLATNIAELRKTDNPLNCIVPVFFRISEYAQYLEKTGKTLYEYITEHMDKQYSYLFIEGFEYSNLLLLMDGLDEVTETRLRIRVAEQVDDLMARYPLNHYVVTSRIVGYQESRLGSGFKQFELLPFGNEEISTFSRQWYRAIALHTDQNFDFANEQAESIINSISRNTSVMKLASNPLLMTIIALIHYRGKKLPNRRIELYDISTETFLEHWVNLRREIGHNESSQLKDKNEIIEIMAPIAFEIHETKSNGLIEESSFRNSFIKNYQATYECASELKARSEYKNFLNFLQQDAGFFYEKGTDDQGQPLYGFIHLTFEEYFAAIHFMCLWMGTDFDLKKYAFDPRWTEIIRLAAAQIRYSIKGPEGRIKATEFVTDILNVDDNFPEAKRPLHLVCLILADDVSVKDEMYQRIFNKILDIFTLLGDNKLVNSFFRLFKELLSSDRKEIYLDMLTKELTSTNDSNLRKNLVRLLMENSEDKQICEFLTEIVSRWKANDRICREIFSIDWNEYAIQKSSSFLTNFKEYIKSLPVNDGEEWIDAIMESFIEVMFRDRWINLDVFNWDKGEALLNEFYGTHCFDSLLFSLFRYNVLDLGDMRNKSEVKRILKRFPESVHATNLLILMGHKEDTELYLAQKLRLRFFEIKFANLIGSAEISINSSSSKKKQIFRIYILRSNFELIFRSRLKSKGKFFRDNEISDLISHFSGGLSQEDVMNVKNYIYGLLGSSGDKDVDIKRINKASQSNLLFPGIWDIHYLFTLLPYNPITLSEIIIKKSINFVNRENSSPLKGLEEEEKKAFSISDLEHPDIVPPVRLLAYYIKKVPYDNQLILETINYYRSCPPEEKEGVFTILYTVLNKFE